MFNLRYHVASLAAVFLALAVGLLLGTAIADRSTLDAGQQRLIQSVQAEFSQLRAANQALSRQLEAVRPLEEAAATRFAAGQLAGARVLVVVEGSGVPETAASLIQRMRAAGARVQTMSLRRPGLGVGERRVFSSLAVALERSGLTTEQARDAALAALPDEITRPDAGPVLKALVSGGVAALDPGQPLAATGVVLFYSGSDPGASDLPRLAAELSKQDVRAVGVETSDIEPSAISAFSDAQVPSVDDVDRPVGQFSAILVLANDGIEGHFGSKPTATAPMPPLGRDGR